MCRHTKSDSVSVCPECGITLAMVNALQNSQLNTWADVRDAYQYGTLLDVRGIGKVFYKRFLDMRILSAAQQEKG